MLNTIHSKLTFLDEDLLKFPLIRWDLSDYFLIWINLKASYLHF